MGHITLDSKYWIRRANDEKERPVYLILPNHRNHISRRMVIFLSCFSCVFSLSQKRKENEMKFYNQLLGCLNSKPFNRAKAEELSDTIQAAEENGYEITRSEDRLWEKLTDKLLSNA